MAYKRPLGDIIKEYRTLHGMTMQEFADRAMVTKSYVSMLENNVNPKTGKPTLPVIDTAENIARAMHMSVNDMLGKMHVIEATPVEAMKSVPLIGKIACGLPITAVENWEGQLPVAISNRATFALRASGDSMEPEIRDGDIVFIQEQSTVDDGEIAAVLVDGEATLKKVKYMNGIDTTMGIILIPINPDFEPTILNNPDEPVYILGKYLGLQRGRC